MAFKFIATGKERNINRAYKLRNVDEICWILSPRDSRGWKESNANKPFPTAYKKLEAKHTMDDHYGKRKTPEYISLLFKGRRPDDPALAKVLSRKKNESWKKWNERTIQKAIDTGTFLTAYNTSNDGGGKGAIGKHYVGNVMDAIHHLLRHEQHGGNVSSSYTHIEDGEDYMNFDVEIIGTDYLGEKYCIV